MKDTYFFACQLGSAWEEANAMLRMLLIQGLNVQPEPAKMPPHITFVAPRQLTLREMRRATDRLESMVARKAIRPIEAMVGNMKAFDQGYLYYPVGGKDLIDLMRYVIDQLRFESGPYEAKTPHCTLFEVPPEILKLAYGYIRDMPPPARTIRIESLGIWKKGMGGEKNELVGNVPLGNLATA